MSIGDAFILCLAMMFSGLLLGLAHILYQRRFMEDSC